MTKITKAQTTHSHTFIANMFGTFAYVAILFIWLLVLNLIVTLASLRSVLDSVSYSLSSATTAFYVVEPATSAEGAAEPAHAPLRFLLTIILFVLIWIFCYFVAKVGSRLFRHFLVLFGRKPSLVMLATIKYLMISMGVIGLCVLLQFVSPVLGVIQLPIAFMGLVAGIVGVGATWVQQVLAARYHITPSRIL